MSQKPSTTRGRGRGRASGDSARSAVQEPRGPSQTPRLGAQGQEVQQRRPGAAGEASSFGRATHRPTQKIEHAKDLATRMGAVSIASSGNGNGNGNGNGGESSSIGRGGLRGRRQLPPSEILRTRPVDLESKQGSCGQKITLYSNYFTIHTGMNWTLYQYRVDFKVDEDRSSVKKSWMRECQKAIGNHAYIFDGTVLFTSQRLSAGNEPIQLTTKRRDTDEVILIELRLVGDVQYGDMAYLQVFNLIMRRCLGHLNMQLVGRNYFDARAKISIPEYKMDIWPGYMTSIRQHEKSILMCCEITSKVMRTDNVLSLLQECIQRDPQNFKLLFTQSIVGLVVLTDYNNKTYRIDDVDFSKTPTTKFKLKDGSEISFVEYYQKRYQIPIQDRKQPLLVSKATSRETRAGKSEYCNLVPELCRMTGMTDQMRANFKLMQALAEHTRVGPADRMKRLCNFNDRLSREPKIVEEFTKWGMKLDKNLVQIGGRVLPPEVIIVGNNRKFPVGPSFDWTKELRSAPMLCTIRMNEFIVVCPMRLERDGQNFLQTLIKAGSGMAFNLPNPRIMSVPDDRSVTLCEAVDRSIAKGNPDMIMFFVTNNRPERYNAVKKKCCVDKGILSQVVLAKSLCSKGVFSIATKVAIQMNAKLGGAPWTTEIPLSGLMVVGFDVCHDTNSRDKSYGAMVASLNRTLSNWFSAVSPHVNGEELSNSFALDLYKAIRKYKETNNALPSRIIIYRDGVGEGQLHYVFHHEVEILKKRLTETYGNQSWRLAYVVVTKRINTRIFLTNGSNPQPGTVVDEVITLPEKYDFFLVSQTVKQGTVAPTSYNVISDNLELNPDKLQRLTYKLTHVYYNWSGTIRVPAPVHYAHKLAFLVGQSLHNEPNPCLDNKLYFL